MRTCQECGQNHKEASGLGATMRTVADGFTTGVLALPTRRRSLVATGVLLDGVSRCFGVSTCHGPAHVRPPPYSSC